MTTLVLCIDRSGDIGRKAGVRTPVAGWEAVRSLVTDVGLADPEDVGVNTILEALRVTRALQDEGEEVVVAVVSGTSDTAVTADRTVAEQLDALVTQYQPDAAVAVLGRASDERVLPVLESRLPVDSVDRVVVRQARDIESTYYLLKQFLADEELRRTVLVPVGVGLVVLPVLLVFFSPAIAVAGLASLLGLTLLYYGLSIDDYVESAPERIRAGLYSGQVSVVTYVAGAGLAAVGAFVGAVESPGTPRLTFIWAMQFVYAAIPWLALAALTASFGRLLDELIRDEGVRTPYLNLPFGVLAVGLVLRGFAGYFLELEAGREPLTVAGMVLTPTYRLGLFIMAGIIVSLVGVRVATRLSEETLDEVIEPKRGRGSDGDG